MLKGLAAFFGGIVAVLLCAELVFRLLPVSTATMTGYHHDPRVLTYPSHHRWWFSTGWDLRNAHALRANNLGFASNKDFLPTSDAVALIGDSYVEAAMLPEFQRPAAQLEALLSGRRPVYGMGGPGSALLDYAERIRIASVQLGVRDVVLLLESFDARQSLCGSGNTHGPCLDSSTLEAKFERLPEPGAIKRLLRHSSLAQYAASQIRVRPSAIWRSMWTRSVPEESRPSETSDQQSISAVESAAMRRKVDAVVTAFSERTRALPLHRLVMVVDGYRGGPTRPSLADVAERQYLIQRLRESGYLVHDLEPDFAEHAQRSSWSLDVGPYDRHLNAKGVQLAMRAAATFLRD